MTFLSTVSYDLVLLAAGYSWYGSTTFAMTVLLNITVANFAARMCLRNRKTHEIYDNYGGCGREVDAVHLR